MNKQRLQQLAGIKPLFEKSKEPRDQYEDWKEQAQQEFIDQYPHVTDDPDELEITDEGGVYHRPSNQRWPDGTVTSYQDSTADNHDTVVDREDEEEPIKREL